MADTLTGRLNFRLTDEQERALRQAAALSGQSVSGFVLSTAVERAHVVLERANRVELAGSEFQRFVEDLDRPAEAVPELVKLFGRTSRIPDRVTPAKLRAVELFNPARHDSSTFDCGVAGLEKWLRRTAPVAAAAGTSATWVLCRARRVVGYYALAMGSIQHQGTPSRVRRGQPDPVPVLLLARLALDSSEQGQGLGADLLRDALIRSVAGARRYGARALVLDAIDEAAAAFYKHHGFLPLTANRLYRRMSDIERSLLA